MDTPLTTEPKRTWRDRLAKSEENDLREYPLTLVFMEFFIGTGLMISSAVLMSRPEGGWRFAPYFAAGACLVVLGWTHRGLRRDPRDLRRRRLLATMIELVSVTALAMHLAAIL